MQPLFRRPLPPLHHYCLSHRHCRRRRPFRCALLPRVTSAPLSWLVKRFPSLLDQSHRLPRPPASLSPPSLHLDLTIVYPPLLPSLPLLETLVDYVTNILDQCPHTVDKSVQTLVSDVTSIIANAYLPLSLTTSIRCSDRSTRGSHGRSSAFAMLLVTASANLHTPSTTPPPPTLPYCLCGWEVILPYVTVPF